MNDEGGNGIRSNAGVFLEKGWPPAVAITQLGSLWLDGDGSSHRSDFKEGLSHAVGEPDAAMGVGDSRQESGVHADPVGKLHEPWHRGTLEMGSCGRLVLLGIHILDDDVAGGIHEISIEIGGMFLLLLANLEIADRGVMPFAASGDGRDTDQLASLVVVEFLVADIDDDRGGTAGAFSCPIGDPVGKGGCGGLGHDGPVGAEIPGGRGIQPTVIGGAGRKQQRDDAGGNREKMTSGSACGCFVHETLTY